MIISRIIIIKFNDHQQYMAAILVSMMLNVMLNVILIAMISDIVKVPLSQRWIKFRVSSQRKYTIFFASSQHRIQIFVKKCFCDKTVLYLNVSLSGLQHFMLLGAQHNCMMML